MENIICPKCGSDRIAHFVKEPPKEPEPVTIDEYIDEGSDFEVTPAVMHYTEMVLLCKDCGYRREYTSPRGSTVDINAGDCGTITEAINKDYEKSS